MYLFLLVAVFFSVGSIAQKPEIYAIDTLPADIKVINAIETENDSLVWIATNRGLLKFSAGKVVRFFDPDNAGLYKINYMLVDNKGNKWLGSYRSSIIRFREGEPLQEFSFLSSVGNEMMLVTGMSLAYTPDSTNYDIILATSNGQILRFSTQNKTFAIEKTSPTTNNIAGLYINQRGNMWISSSDGLFFRKRNKWKRIPELVTSSGVYQNGSDTWAVGKRPDNMPTLMYFLNYQYQFFFANINRQRWQEMFVLGLPVTTDRINDLDFDSKGIIWMAVDDGFAAYQPITGQAQFYGSSDISGFAPQNVQHIAVQNDNTIWLSSSGRNLYRIVFNHKR